ncbi:hypothetical protein [Arthrobacter sp. PAMC25284]|uniref:hypothetical protein n=1 Tax=Arthrobacter sp. PAMC25284 TaxID=2861279 RepID=UPI001C6384A7|nr:hypothetical protein [Arthrobacter sp. PAMC25284]QYF89130.1 hypothetical protein KY499_13395 [Arthrobacter sp. PAMC25284]
MSVCYDGSGIARSSQWQLLRRVERDVLFFPKEAEITFETPDYGMGFFTAHGSMSSLRDL